MGRARSEAHTDKCDGATHIPVFSGAAWQSPECVQPGPCPAARSRVASFSRCRNWRCPSPGSPGEEHQLENGFVEVPLVSFPLPGVSSPRTSPFSPGVHSESRSGL